jgi:two-component system copper resistance phosphate regulon response regulator CusR
VKLLVVEDESITADRLRQGLSEARFVMDLARNGLDGHNLALTGGHDRSIRT